MGTQDETLHTGESSERVEDSERWKIWLDAARISIENKSFAEAEAGLRLALELKPDSVEVLMELCVLLLQLRRETDAERVGKKLLKLTGGKKMTWAQLRSNLRQKQVDKGKYARKEKAIEEDKKEPEVEEPHKDEDHMKSYPSRRKSEGATQVRTPVKDPQPKPVSLRTQESKQKFKPQEREKITTTMRTATPRQTTTRESYEDRTAVEWYEWAQLYSKKDQQHDALRALQNALKLDPTHRGALILSGEIFFDMKRYEEAVSVLTKAVEVAPRNPRVWYLLGMSHESLGNDWEASQAFYKCVAIDEKYIDAWAELGISLSKQGRHAQAQKAYLKALRERRDDARLLTFYGVSLRETGKHNRALNIFRMAIAENPDYAPAWEQLAKSFIAQGQHESATEARQMALKLQRMKGISTVLE